MLTADNDHDEIAKRRVLMLLSVLSGERAVTEVIAEHRISRPTYYQQETKALQAMLEALTPGRSGPKGPSKVDELTKRVEQMQAKLEAAQRKERRTQRLLHLTRKMVKPGSVTTGKKRPRKARARRNSPAPGIDSSSSPKTPNASPTAKASTKTRPSSTTTGSRSSTS
jgi:hypothetical protein